MNMLGRRASFMNSVENRYERLKTQSPSWK